MFPADTSEYVGFGALALAVLAFIRFFLWRQIKDLRKDVATLEGKVEKIEARYDEERGLKHKAYNDVARTTMALDLVRSLARECTCNVLGPLPEIIDRVMDELETLHHKAVTEGEPS